MRFVAEGVTLPLLLALALSACAPAPADGQAGSVPSQGAQQAPAPAAARGRAAGEVAAPQAETEEAVAVGAVIATSGSAALLGREELLGVEIAEEVLNAEGGVAGRPVEVVVQDTGGDDDGARAAFQTLVNADEVVGVAGPTLARHASAVSAIAGQSGVPTLGPAGATTQLTGDGAYFRISSPVPVSAPSAMDVALEESPEITRVAFAFAQDDATSSSETVVQQGAARERRLTIATVQSYQSTAPSLSRPAGAIVATDPGLVVISGTATDGGLLVRELRDLGYGGPIIGGSAMNTAELFAICRKACDGLLLAQSYNPETDNAANQVFRQAFQERHGREPSQPSAQAFTAVQVLVEALRAVEAEQGLASLDLSALRAALRAAIPSAQYETPMGTLAFTPEGEVVQGATHVTRIEMSEDGGTGRFVLVR